jgi:hypothetical protein
MELSYLLISEFDTSNADFSGADSLTNVHYHFYYDYVARSLSAQQFSSVENRVLPCIRTTAEILIK